MAAEAKFLAFDLGAESGRGVVGLFDGETLRLEIPYRFGNRPVRLLDTQYWDAPGLFASLKQGLSMAATSYGRQFSSLGIDTWGVDFGLLGRDGALLANPRCYRDRGNDGMMELAFATVPREEIFARTGIQLMQINTLFQLLALRQQRSSLLDVAETLLMMPDLLNYWFTGEKVSEFSIATTSQCYDPSTKDWARGLLRRLELPADLFTPIVQPGATIGTLRADIADEAGCDPMPIVAPAEHDTASAVVGVPASSPDYAFLSSGTWSLMGIETTTPQLSEATQAANFTNEGGACGTIRLLKNIMGLWLAQECRRGWARQGTSYSYDDLAQLASEAPPFVSLVEPDDPAFLAPDDMIAALRAFCARTGQPVPETPGAVMRCCLESLALKYRWTLERLEAFRGRRIETIHIVGGGAQNRLLCQFAANATRRAIVAGPVEATAIGNILMQAIGRGYLSSLDEARAVVRRSFEPTAYTPHGSGGDWEAAYARFLHFPRA